MIPIGSIVKWGAIAFIAGALVTGVKKGYEYHLDQIDTAVVAAEKSIALEQSKLANARETELKELAAAEKERIEEELIIERAKVTDLRRMLLVEHDLDRLLQQKPGLILPRVNKGTEDYFVALEESTR